MKRIAQPFSKVVFKNFVNKNASPLSQRSKLQFECLISARQYSRGKSDDNPNSFTNIFKNMVQQEMANNEDLQKKIKELQNTGTANTAKNLSDKTKELADSLKTVSRPLAFAVQHSAEQLAYKAEQVVASAPVQAVAQGVSKVAEVVADQPMVKRVVEEMSQEERERRKLHYFFKSAYGRQKDKEEGIYFNPYTNRVEKEGEQQVNEAATAVSINLREKPKTGFDRFADKVSDRFGNGMVHGIMSKAANIGNKIFKANEQSTALSMIIQNDPTFEVQKFLDSVQYNVIPKVMNAFFANDVETVKYHVTDLCWSNYFLPIMEANKQMKQRFDSKILDIGEVELSTSRMINDNPVLVLNAHVQYVYCVRNDKDEIVEGGPSSIRMDHQLWIFQQDPSGETKDWEVAECIFGTNIRL